MNISPALRQDRWGVFRVALAILSLVLATVSTLSRSSRFELLCGRGCRAAENAWFSTLFLVCLVGGSAAAFYSQFWVEPVVRRRIAAALGVAGVLAFGAMLTTGHICSLCLAAQVVWVGLGIEASGLLGVRVFAVLVTCVGLEGSYEAWSLTSRPPADPVPFALRNGERLAKAPPYAFVVFTDPDCPYCRKDERLREGKPSPIPVVYRWKIVHGTQATRLAAGIESGLALDRTKGMKLFRDVYATQTPPDESAFIALGVKDGFDPGQLKAWIETPAALSLTAVSNDGRLAERLGVDIVPSLCAVEPTDPERAGTNVRPIRAVDIKAYSEMTGLDLSSMGVYFH